MAETKSGVKTSEFWGKCLLQLGMIFGAFKGFLSPSTAAISTAALEGAYGVSRAYVKAKRGVDLPPLQD